MLAQRHQSHQLSTVPAHSFPHRDSVGFSCDAMEGCETMEGSRGTQETWSTPGDGCVGGPQGGQPTC